jgi:hypothetical protein
MLILDITAPLNTGKRAGIESRWRGRWVNSRDDPSNCDKNANHGFIPDCSSRYDPAQSDNGAGLDMADDSAGYWAGLRNDEELGHVDYAGKEAGLDEKWRLAEVCRYEVTVGRNSRNRHIGTECSIPS